MSIPVLHDAVIPAGIVVSQRLARSDSGRLASAGMVVLAVARLFVSGLTFVLTAVQASPRR